VSRRQARNNKQGVETHTLEQTNRQVHNNGQDMKPDERSSERAGAASVRASDRARTRSRRVIQQMDKWVGQAFYQYWKVEERRVAMRTSSRPTIRTGAACNA